MKGDGDQIGVTSHPVRRKKTTKSLSKIPTLDLVTTILFASLNLGIRERAFDELIKRCKERKESGESDTVFMTAAFRLETFNSASFKERIRCFAKMVDEIVADRKKTNQPSS